MSLKTISAQDAAALDKDLMDARLGGFSLDQLMELAGLSVSQAVYRVHPPSKGKNILVACGPGNNGGDGLVAARHLIHYGYKPTVYYPKEGKNELYQRLKTQLHNLSVPFISDFPTALQSSDLLIDAIFGFSFKGPLREPFASVISQMESTSVPVLSVDAPSSWEIESGPPPEGQPGAKFVPQTLISLTAAKPLVKWFTGGRHFLGGRFLTGSIAEKYGLELPEYPGIDQIVEVDVNGAGKL
ncbi:YjeF family domain-containing protein [Polytolypa hystricis UAMH7299]|uniref:NAD(P)H-hydrate epimerase n=1 Tax=Polytolypa hystricis (strain UAMH7299) TaxID=1447883 RepID=A0A2B7XWF2_POLH7|nr:YjeF family domain-containing protein [Polytolypa hystricis UAMH7299]